MSGTSHPETRDWSLERYLKLRPSSVLDVGAGSGTYARAFRPQHEGSFWCAIEVHQPYVDKYGLTELYDSVMVTDARTTLLEMNYEQNHFDLIVMGDVVEHVVKVQGAQIIARALQITDNLLVAMPIGEYPQGSIDGNDHEEHLATWSHEEIVDCFYGSGGHLEFFEGSVVNASWWSRA